MSKVKNKKENIKSSKRKITSYEDYQQIFQQKLHKPEGCGMIQSEGRRKEKLAIMYT